MRLIDLNKIPHKAFRGDRDDLVDALLAAPTVDAVPVVRCKDCKWYRIDGGHSNCGWRNMDDDFSENFYCADGERKGGDE